MLTWEGSWPNSLVRRPPWLQACSVKNKTNKHFVHNCIFAFLFTKRPNVFVHKVFLGKTEWGKEKEKFVTVWLKNYDPSSRCLYKWGAFCRIHLRGYGTALPWRQLVEQQQTGQLRWENTSFKWRPTFENRGCQNLRCWYLHMQVSQDLLSIHLRSILESQD